MAIVRGWRRSEISVSAVPKSACVQCVLNSYLRLRERGRMAVALQHSSLEILSVQKCLERKCSSSGVGWKGSWCSFSCDEQDDWKWNTYIFNEKRKNEKDFFFVENINAIRPYRQPCTCLFTTMMWLTNLNANMPIEIITFVFLGHWFRSFSTV